MFLRKAERGTIQGPVILTCGVASSHLIFRERQPQHPVKVLTRLTLRVVELCPFSEVSMRDEKRDMFGGFTKVTEGLD